MGGIKEVLWRFFEPGPTPSGVVINKEKEPQLKALMAAGGVDPVGFYNEAITILRRLAAEVAQGRRFAIVDENGEVVTIITTQFLENVRLNPRAQELLGPAEGEN